MGRYICQLPIASGILPLEQPSGALVACLRLQPGDFGDLLFGLLLLQSQLREQRVEMPPVPLPA